MIRMILFVCLPEDMFDKFPAALVKYFKIALMSIKDMIETVNFIFKGGFYFDLSIVQVLDLIHIVVLFGSRLELDKYLQ